MAITENELNISNKSYTNKDFESIYLELLEIANKISNRIKPTETNETDPFIVLLKLLAIVADKVNYNIDKNTLERFMSSCTQTQSMRELTEMLGYNMHYYRSAKTSVIFKYPFTNETRSIIIPAFTTKVLTPDNIEYITLKDASINKATGTSQEVEVIQGQLKQLSVLGCAKIQLENIDSKNRLYLPEIRIAENGIFISNNKYSTSDWTCVTNLNNQEYDSTVYKFGFDSKKNLPYLEFPEWISDIIADGLTISYIVTDGEGGNISAKSISAVSGLTLSSSEPNADNSPDISKITVTNLYSATSGSSPETINESYEGFKKIVGTFDVLTTCRDYANKIYNLLDNDGNYLVSNTQVGDRRTDLNYSCDVLSYGDSGVENTSIISKTENEPDITAFDLTLYGLTPITDTSFTSIRNGIGGYNKSYKPVTASILNNITYRLENENKCISHDIKKLKDADIFSIIDYYTLHAVINTVSKVNLLEQQEIIVNVYTALARDYNPRKLNFGYEIPFDSILTTMENADKRIKSVSLQEPDHTPVIVRADGDEVEDASTNNNYMQFITAKNVLAGRIPLFNYDNDFTYSYNYSNMHKYEDVTKISESTCNIPSIAGNDEYILKANEVIEFIAPTLSTKTTYTSGIYYNLSSSDGSDTNITIKANAEYRMSDSDTLILAWKDSNGKVVSTKINAKSPYIIKPNFEMTSIDQNSSSIFHAADDLDYKNAVGSRDFYTVGTEQQIEVKEPNIEKLTTTEKMYWIMNNESNSIEWEPVEYDETSKHYKYYEYILKENEYFYHSDLALTSLFSYGSGTKIKISYDLYNSRASWGLSQASVDASSINESGLSNLGSIFEIIPLSSSTNYQMYIFANDIVTLVEGDTIKNTSAIGLSISDNVFNEIPSGISIDYKQNNADSFTTLQNKSELGSDYNWHMRSILDIDAGPDKEQNLVGNQKIKFTLATGDKIIEINSGTSFKFNVNVLKDGGKDLSLAYINISENTSWTGMKNSYPKLLTYTYNKNIDSSHMLDNNFAKFTLTEDEKDEKGSITKKNSSISIDIPSIKDGADNILTEKRYVMIYVAGTNNTINVKMTEEYTNGNNDTCNEITSLNAGINMIEFKDKTTKISLVGEGFINDTDAVVIVLSKMSYVTGLNPLLGLEATNGKSNIAQLTAFITYLKTNFTEQYSKFYSTADLDEAKQIEVSSRYPLSSSQAFYDYNNIANKWVIGKIDFENSDITIARSSRK